MRALFCSVTLMLLSLGCSETTRPDPLDLSSNGGTWQPGLSGGGGAQGYGSYPKGPYGADNPAVGSVMPNLEFFGYFNPEGIKPSAEREYGRFSLQDVRKKGGRYLLMHPAAIWCGACYVEASQLNRELSNLLGEQVSVVQVVVDGSAPGADPTKAELDAWMDFSDLRLNVGIASDDNLRDIFPERGYLFLVDLQSMEVLYQVQGVQLDPSIVDLALQELRDNWLNQPN